MKETSLGESPFNCALMAGLWILRKEGGETYHRDDRRRRISVPQGASLLIRRGIQAVLGLLHGICLMDRLLGLLLRLLLVLLQPAYTSLWTAQACRCAVRCADLPGDLSITL